MAIRSNMRNISYQMQVKENNVEIVDKMKILGTIVNNTLSWDENCNHLIKIKNATSP